jgi:hypothetical protein
MAAQAIHLTALLPGEGSEFNGQGFEPQLPKGDYTLSNTWQDAASTAEYSLSVGRLGSALGELEAIGADGKRSVVHHHHGVFRQFRQ